MNEMANAIEEVALSVRHSIMECRSLSRNARSHMATGAARWMEAHHFSTEEMDDEIDDKMRPLALCLEHLEEASRYLEMAEYNMNRIE